MKPIGNIYPVHINLTIIDIKYYVPMKKEKWNGITFILITALFFIAIVAGIYGSSNRNMLKLAKANAVSGLKSTLESKAHTIEEYISREEDMLRQYSMLPEITDLLLDETNKDLIASVQNYTVSLFASFSKWEGLYVGNPDTRILVHSDPTKNGVYTRTPETIGELIDGMEKNKDLFNIGIIPSPVSGKLLMSMYSPVYKNGEFIGYVGGGPFAEDLKDLLDRIHPKSEETSDYYIVNLAKKIFIYNEDINQMGVAIESPILLDAISKIGAASALQNDDYTFKDGKDSYIVAYYEMPDYGWAVIAIDSEEEVYRQANANSRVLMRNGILALIVFLIIITTLSRFLGKEKTAREKADSENKKKSAFLANMSHEIRTPMNAVSGMADVLLTTDLTDNQRKYVSSIKYAGTSLVSLVNDILDYSKIDSGNMSLVPVEYSTQKLFSNVAMIIQNRITTPDLQLIIDIDKMMPRLLYGDDIRIKQILINLLTNAVKFTENGHVKLSVKVIKTENLTATIRYRISDTGSGIKPEDLDKLFSSFSQVDTTRNREKEGTGLGLAICKMLATLMDGTIDVKSEYGRGSTFTVTIEQKIIDSRPMEPIDTYVNYNNESETTFTISDVDILVVDDNVTNLLVTKELLKQLNPRSVDTCSTGPESIIKASVKKYDIIFMDHMMPDMDGIEAISKIRNLEGFNDYYKTSTIVALTANAMSEAKEAFAKVGVTDFITKPFEYRELKATIRSILPEEKIK